MSDPIIIQKNEVVGAYYVLWGDQQYGPFSTYEEAEDYSEYLEIK